MHSCFIPLFISHIVAPHAQCADKTKEVEGGVQLLSTGPLQLIIPEIFTFTIKNEANCDGDFVICYVSLPKVNRDELKKYHNVGHKCPLDSCKLWMETDGGVYGIAMERHDGNFYGMLVKGSKSMCPLYFDKDGRSNFTILELPTCPVIIDGAMIPVKDETTEPSQTTSMNWIIPVCVGLGLLLLVIGVVGIFIYCRSNRKNDLRANSIEQKQRLSKSSSLHNRKSFNSNRNTPNSLVSTPQKISAKKVAPASPKATTPTNDVSNSASTNDDA
uniref:Uncharacterized protein n=1 Tax=Panagrellus redivivus TaxID=6233 RepID=A0A7E4VTD9_PANRE